ncbi:MAG TPA: CHAT domain-containing protein, partial [Blastocatellia bacterium]|nr:CHAT domain-containing protein [Blastocatellia bacterium]
RGEAGTLLGIAQIEQARGNLVPARQTLEQALAIIESLRANIESQELRASYFASQQELYQCYIDVLMQLHRRNPAAAIDVEALAVSERARARSLLELLAESRADIRQGVDPALLSRERLLQQQLNAKAAAQLRLLNRPHTSAQAEAAAKELASVAAEYDELQTRIHAASPGYAALTRPAPLTLKELQTRVLDGDTLLLEYALGRERSYLWAVTSSSVTGYELPKRAVIEAAARRVYELFSSGQDFADEVQTAAAALSGMLLGPVASRLGNRRLLIVADGALQYLPFGALPVPHSGSSGERSGRAAEVPMIVNHEIVSLPSASTLAVLRREQAVRPEVSGVAVVADPVFDRNDPRVKLETAEPTIARLQSAELSTRRLERSVRESGVLSFGRLRSTRREAEEIVALAGEGESLKALDFDASRATVLSGQLSRFRVVHFATHGLLNSQHPHLSGIVLSLVDEQGQPQEGFLLAHEVYNLKLGAELVVLSGCQTALGKEIKGEGLVGLTRGFMYAGAPRVIASLWRVPDRETAELMRRFYQGLLKERLRPAAALRAAQIEMWKEKRLAAPYNWAAFVLQGEWK